MWSDIAWNESYDIIKKIEELPFVLQLKSGKLSAEKFLQFIQKDSIYLSSYYTILLTLNNQLTSEAEREEIIPNIQNTIRVEHNLHKIITDRFNFTIDNEVKPTRNNQIFNRETEIINNLNNPAYTFASLLPSYLIYAHIGKLLYNDADLDNPYRIWIDTYGKDEYLKQTEIFKSHCDKHAEKCNGEVQEKMTEIFKLFMNMEYLLWGEAFNKENQNEYE